jgi:Holliday junction resolvasome RuvABC endonuclease subunit
MNKILGLDISTSNIGLCVADEDDKIYEFISIPLSKIVKDKDLFKKLLLFEVAIDKVLAKHDIEHIFIEKALEFFSSGTSMAHTIILLNQFNILCQYAL